MNNEQQEHTTPDLSKTSLWDDIYNLVARRVLATGYATTDQAAEIATASADKALADVERLTEEEPDQQQGSDDDDA